MKNMTRLHAAAWGAFFGVLIGGLRAGHMQADEMTGYLFGTAIAGGVLGAAAHHLLRPKKRPTLKDRQPADD